MKSFPYYKHLLQENYVEYIFFLPLFKLVSKILSCVYCCYSCITCWCQNGVHCNVCNQGKTVI